MTAIAAQAGSVQVARRWPGPSTAEEGIYLGDVIGEANISALTATNARARREERYRIEIVCQAWRSAHTPLDADDSEDRAYALFAHVENAVAADVDVNATVKWSQVVEFRDETIPFDKGWATRLTVVLSCTARLT